MDFNYFAVTSNSNPIFHIWGKTKTVNTNTPGSKGHIYIYMCGLMNCAPFLKSTNWILNTEKGRRGCSAKIRIFFSIYKIYILMNMMDAVMYCSPPMCSVHFFKNYFFLYTSTNTLVCVCAADSRYWYILFLSFLILHSSYSQCYYYYVHCGTLTHRNFKYIYTQYEG